MELNPSTDRLGLHDLGFVAVGVDDGLRAHGLSTPAVHAAAHGDAGHRNGVVLSDGTTASGMVAAVRRQRAFNWGAEGSCQKEIQDSPATERVSGTIASEAHFTPD